VPPKVSLASSAYPAGPVHQDLTKWNGDNALNGGNKEWAEEDGALHAFNMANWRVKILQTQLNKQKMMWQLMHSVKSGCGHGQSCGHSSADVQLRQAQTESTSDSQQREDSHAHSSQSKEVRRLEREVKKQAEEIHQLEQHVGGHGKEGFDSSAVDN